MDSSLSIILAFALSFLASFATTPLVKNLAFKVGAIDIPKDERKIHKKPIPRLGGLAIFYGFIASVLIFAEITREIRGIILGVVVIVLLGIFDDIYQLSAKVKFPIQIIAAIIPILHGVVISYVSMPRFIVPEGTLYLSYFSYPLTVFWIVAVTNAVNLIDGLDGLAVGVSSISSLSLLCIALIVSEPQVALLTAALAGACFGFLPYNFNPAKIFMGDTGATFLGFILATVSVQGLFKAYAVISFAVPLLVLGLPIFDTGFTILRRIKNKKPIMGADRGHLHHKLLDMGFSQKQTVGILCLMSSILCLSAIILIGSGALRALVLVALILVFIIFAARNSNLSEFLKDEEENAAPQDKNDLK